MATDPTIDPSETTPIEGELSSETKEPSTEATPSVEELTEKLAAAENEAKTWKGRAEKATKGKPKDADSISEEELDWKIANTNRISLVKEAYEKELQELKDSGAKVTPSLKTKALEYAESKSGVTKSATQESSDSHLPTPSVDRSGKREPRMNEYDVAMGIKPETKKEFADVVEG